MRPKAERRIRGTCASPGCSAGPAFILSRAPGRRTASGDASSEATSLREAIAAAAQEIDKLAESTASDAAEVLQVQAELLRDEELARTAFEAIGRGVAADQAWMAALEAEMAGYEAADDEYFRARAADLRDLQMRVLRRLMGRDRSPDVKIPPGPVVFADDLLPSDFLDIDWTSGGGIVLSAGSRNSHVAMLARSRGIPMLVGTGLDPEGLEGEVLVDGAAGLAILGPLPATRAAFEAKRRQKLAEDASAAQGLALPATTRDGCQVKICLNVADPKELASFSPDICDGIGLVRSEFLFRGIELPSEDRQHAAYVQLLAWADGRPVTIRTLDAGGDKPIPGLTIEGESNPFLGKRGIRLSLARPDVFRVQLRALARAACHGPLRIMLPMVTAQAELAAARTLLETEIRRLNDVGIPARRPLLGIMVEVPAAAIAIETFDADFYSIGSNDLVQYVTAAARDAGGVADVADPLHPAVLKLIRYVAGHGAAVGREVSLCGEAGSDPVLIPHLLAAGLRSLSVPPAAVAGTKATIRTVDLPLAGQSGGQRTAAAEFSCQ